MKSSHTGKGFGQWLWWCPTPAIPTVPPSAVGCLVRSQPSVSFDGVPCWVTAIGYLIRSLLLRAVGGVVHPAAAVTAIGVVCPLLCCFCWWVLCPTVVVAVGAWWVTVAKGAPPLAPVGVPPLVLVVVWSPPLVVIMAVGALVAMGAPPSRRHGHVVHTQSLSSNDKMFRLESG